MSDYFDEEFEEEFDSSELTDQEVLRIQEEYQKKRLRETLLGPIISTVFHVALIIVLAIMVTDKFKQEPAEIVVSVTEIEEVQIEEPPVEEPEPDPVEEEMATTPVLTTIAVENATAEDSSLEDVNDEVPSTDDASELEAVSDIVISPSAFTSPNVFGGRSAGGRAAAVSKFGGTKAGQQSLLKALRWLARVQNPDGSWGEKSEAGFTGLALLAFLAHGETPSSKNFGTHIKKAIQWLINDPVQKGTRFDSYDHPIKAYALSEAYAMTGISMIEPAMNESMRLIIDNQQPGGSYDYGYKTSEGRQDLSLAGWNYQAMKAAYSAGCEESGLDEAIHKSVDWLKKMGGSSLSFVYDYANNDSSKPKGAHARKPSMRAVGSLCLQLFGEGNCPEIQDDIRLIATQDIQSLNWQNAPDFSIYSWYYATQVMFQHGGKYWSTWNRKFQKVLTTNQNKEGYWDYPNLHFGVANYLETTHNERLYATTLSALMLTVYYRYLPSMKGAIGGKKSTQKTMPEEEEGLNLID